MKKIQHGFTLIELMIVVAIIGILASVAIPAYQNYVLKSKYSEVVYATEPYKIGIGICVNLGDCVTLGAITGVAFGPANAHLPPAPAPTPYLASIVLTPAGVITATGTAIEGLAGETYVLTPTLVGAGQTTWVETGTCTTRAAGRIC